MRSPLDKCVLELERPGYPWQVIESDGVTWIILRQKIKIEKRINELKGVFLDNFNWKVKNINDDEHYIIGDVALTAKYGITDLDIEKIEFADEGEAEELGRELFTKPNKYINEMKKDKPEWNINHDVGNSSFQSLLIDKLTCEKQDVNEHVAEESSSKLALPWQARLLGLGKIKEPIIEKTHMAQIGLNTILLEVLLKLEIEKKTTNYKERGRNHQVSLREERILNINGDTIKELVEVIQHREFYEGLVESEAKSLTIKNEMKISIIYISSQTGGERIMVASCFVHEEKEIKGVSTLSIPPLGYFSCENNIRINKIDMTRIICRWEHRWELLYEYTEEDILVNKSYAKIENNSSTGQNEVPITINRKRPGEKWMKKADSSNAEKMTKKLVLTFKK